MKRIDFFRKDSEIEYIFSERIQKKTEVFSLRRKFRRIYEKLTDYMAEELSAAFEKAGYDSSYGKVGVSNRPDLCEYQCNGAMAGAKAYKKAPFMIADDVVGNLADSKVFSMKEMVKPGFINLKVSEEFLADYLKRWRRMRSLVQTQPKSRRPS